MPAFKCEVGGHTVTIDPVGKIKIEGPMSFDIEHDAGKGKSFLRLPRSLALSNFGAREAPGFTAEHAKTAFSEKAKGQSEEEIRALAKQVINWTTGDQQKVRRAVHSILKQIDAAGLPEETSAVLKEVLGHLEEDIGMGDWISLDPNSYTEKDILKKFEKLFESRVVVNEETGEEKRVFEKHVEKTPLIVD